VFLKLKNSHYEADAYGVPSATSLLCPHKNAKAGPASPVQFSPSEERIYKSSKSPGQVNLLKFKRIASEPDNFFECSYLALKMTPFSAIWLIYKGLYSLSRAKETKVYADSITVGDRSAEKTTDRDS